MPFVKKSPETKRAEAIAKQATAIMFREEVFAKHLTACGVDIGAGTGRAHLDVMTRAAKRGLMRAEAKLQFLLNGEKWRNQDTSFVRADFRKHLLLSLATTEAAAIAWAVLAQGPIWTKRAVEILDTAITKAETSLAQKTAAREVLEILRPCVLEAEDRSEAPRYYAVQLSDTQTQQAAQEGLALLGVTLGQPQAPAPRKRGRTQELREKFATPKVETPAAPAPVVKASAEQVAETMALFGM